MSIMSGSKKAWPVYATIGNISKDVRRRPSQHATVLVGYIPVSDLHCFSNENARSEAGWQLFHTCMASIVAPLKEASVKGEDMLCADGGIRRMHPILASYIADYPEQCTVTCVRESRCPVCWVPGDERADFSKRYEVRNHRQTLDALEDHWGGYSKTIQTLGIRPTVPFWADLPFVEISGSVTPDLLHQLNKGVFKDHILKWCRGILSDPELDRRMKGLPRYQGLRHFTKGISVIKQWTGNEAKALAKIFLPVMSGCKHPEAVSAARCVMDFMYRAHMPELSDNDLDLLERDLAGFHDLKDVFVRAEVVDDEDRFHGIPKIHMLSHYVRSIREFGTTDGYNTEGPERLHIDYVKEGWRASNHVNALEQMTTYLQRKESWAILTAHLRERGVLPESFRTADAKTKTGEAEQGSGAGAGVAVDDEEEETEPTSDSNAEDHEGDEGDKLWYPCPRITTAKRPKHRKKQGAYLIDKHLAVDLIPATRRFISGLPNAPSSFPLSKDSFFDIWTRAKLKHDPLPFLPSAGPQVDQVRASVASYDDEGRMLRFGAFDIVLFSPLPSLNSTAPSENHHGLHSKLTSSQNFVLLFG
jgi:hypothetical protein